MRKGTGYTKEKNGTFTINFYVNGERIKERTNLRAEADARKRVKLLRREAEERHRLGQVQPTETDFTSTLTVGDAFDRYWDEHGRHKADWDTSQGWLARMGEFLGRNRQLSSITNKDLASLVSWRREQPCWEGREGEQLRHVSNATVNRSTTQLLRRVMTIAKEEWEINLTLPNFSKFRLKEPKERVRFASEEELRALFNAMRGYNDHIAVFAFLLYSGLRRSEAINLIWPKVNLNLGLISGVIKGGDEITRSISDQCRAILETRVGHDPVRVFTYVHSSTAEIISDGKTVGRRYPMTPAGFDMWWRSVRRRAAEECPSLLGANGALPFRLHDVRHTCATMMGANGANLEDIQRMLGHANIRTTQKYRHAVESHHRAVLASATDKWAGQIGGMIPLALPAPGDGHEEPSHLHDDQG